MRNLFAMLLCVLLLSACGGGGGAGAGAGAGPSVSLPSAYTGNAGQATVTTSNAKDLASTAYSGSQIASALNVLGKVTTDNDNVQSPLLQEVLSILDSSAATIVQEPKTSSKSVEATSTGSNTIYGYSGSYNFTVSVDPNSGATSGTLSFSQYKTSSTSITMTGTVTFTGVFNQSISSFTSMNMTFNSVTITSGSVNIQMSGTYDARISGPTKTLTLTIVIKDNVTNRTILLKDYNLTLNGNSLSFSGTFYDSTYGYVVISTVTPLTVSTISATPTSGQLLCTGSNGTKARLTFTSSGYTIDADTAGNGTYVLVPA